MSAEREFTALVGTIRPLLDTRARRRVYGRGDLDWEDLVQAGLLAAWLAFPRYSADRGASMATWLSYKALNAMRDELRGMARVFDYGRLHPDSRQREPAEREWLDYVAEHVPDHRARVEFEAFLERSALRHAMQALTAAELEVIERRYWDEASLDEIAARMWCSQARVSYLLAAAHRKLQLRLAGELREIRVRRVRQVA